MITEASDSSVEKTIAPTNVSAEVAADEPIQPVNTGEPSVVTVKVPAEVIEEPSEERTEIASPSFLSSEQTQYAGSEDVP